MKSEKMYIVWGLAKGETEDWKEQPLIFTPKNYKDAMAVIEQATKDGWQNCRLALETSGIPDFSKTVIL